jgi:sortase A
VLAYQVDDILPMIDKDDLDALTGAMQIVPGEDYVTLLTCTPYGINSHRMLVRGHRVENIDDRVIVVTPDAQKIPTYYVIPAVGVPLLFIVLFIMLVASGGHKPKKTGDELLEEFKRNKDHK